jgi:hypothetical protein
MMEGFEMSNHDAQARKIRALVAGLAVVITMGSLTACGNDAPPTTTTRTVTTDTAAPVAPVQQQTTVEKTTTTNP